MPRIDADERGSEKTLLNSSSLLDLIRVHPRESAAHAPTMRLWTLHPKYLDARGLVALWREALLAQKVLQDKTRGYKNHPQLIRFREQRNPVQSIAAYLRLVCAEADSRGYSFDAAKIPACGTSQSNSITATRGQLLHEWAHLQRKLELRAPAKLHEIKQILQPDAHPLFVIVDGNVEAWEKT